MTLRDIWGTPLSPDNMSTIWDGLQCTLVLSLEAIALATVLGFLLCMARLSSFAWVRGLAAGWLAIFRNTPLLVQLLFWYFGFPSLLPESLRNALMIPTEWNALGTVWESPSWEFVSSLVGLTLYTAAYIAEECRAGVATVSKGQWRAAQALGMSPMQTWRCVILPQALRTMISPLMGQYMNVVKNSSLAMAVGCAELMYSASSINDATQKTFQVFAIATALYIAIVLIFELINILLSACVKPLHGQRN